MDIYILGCIVYGDTQDGEYCFDILDYMVYTLKDIDDLMEREAAVNLYKEVYGMNKTPTIVVYVHDYSVFFNSCVLIHMFKPLSNASRYRVSLGYYDDPTIQYMICRIGDVVISSDYPGCPINMAGVPWNMFSHMVDEHSEVCKCIPETLMIHLDQAFTKKKQIVE